MSTALYWFTNDLRIEDNTALSEAMSREKSLMCIFCVDPDTLKQSDYRPDMPGTMGPYRVSFLYDSLIELKKALKHLGLHLSVYITKPEKLLAQLMKRVQIHKIYCAAQSGYYERSFFSQVPRVNGIKVESFETSSLFLSESLPFPVSDIPLTFSKFRRAIEAHQVPVAAISPLPRIAAKPGQKPLETTDYLHKLKQYSATDIRFKGGEKAGFKQLNAYFSGTLPQSYKSTRNQLDDWDSTTKLSCWLSNGCLSARQIYWRLKEYESNNGANESTYWIFFELLWREFFHWHSIQQGKGLFTFTGLNHFKPLTSYYPSRYQAWCNGKTPSRFINALMNQLNETGYMSNRGRQVVASYFVNELALDWRYGAAYFEKMLIDYDVASNWGNWQYLAGVGTDPQGPRKFNIEKQQLTYDPEAAFINRWVKGSKTPKNLDWVDAADWPISSQE